MAITAIFHCLDGLYWAVVRAYVEFFFNCCAIIVSLYYMNRTGSHGLINQITKETKKQK